MKAQVAQWQTSSGSIPTEYTETTCPSIIQLVPPPEYLPVVRVQSRYSVDQDGGLGDAAGFRDPHCIPGRLGACGWR
jgi:hypothetical protein